MDAADSYKMLLPISKITQSHNSDDQHLYILIMNTTRCTISQIYLAKYSTCFGQVHCPSSGVSQNCIHTIGICHASSGGVC